MGCLCRVKSRCCSGRIDMEITFSQDLDLRYKALLLAGAVSLVSVVGCE